MNSIRITLLCTVLLSFNGFSALGQSTDTLYYYQEEDLVDERQGILDHVLDFGIYFTNPFYSSDILQLDLLFLSDIQDYYGFPAQFEFSFNIATNDSAPGSTLYTLEPIIDDSSDVYPYWQHYDLNGVDTLQNLTSDFWVSGKDLWQLVWDTNDPYSGRVRGNIDNTFWETAEIDIGVRVIVRQNDTDISPESTVPEQTVLLQNYPNPFNGFTTIRLHFPHQTVATLRIFDAGGRLVNVLHESIRVPAGGYTTQWFGLDQTDMPVGSGLYFLNVRYTQEGTSRSLSKKIVLMK